MANKNILLQKGVHRRLPTLAFLVVSLSCCMNLSLHLTKGYIPQAQASVNANILYNRSREHEAMAKTEAKEDCMGRRSIRMYEGARLFENQETVTKDLLTRRDPGAHCRKWSVGITSAAPNPAIAELASRDDDWCMIVLASSDNFDDVTEFDNNPRAVFLSVTAQKEWISKLEQPIRGLFDRGPSSHISRKNLGYLYAIRNGAELIHDFHEDFIIRAPAGTYMFNFSADETQLKDVGYVIQGNWNSFDPSPFFRSSIPFHLRRFQSNRGQGKVIFSKDLRMKKIGVIQLVDARGADHSDKAHPILAPPQSFSPYDARASIHTSAFFWALFMPSSLSNQIADIWRGYFAQAIARELDLGVIFSTHGIVDTTGSQTISTKHDSTTKDRCETNIREQVLIGFLADWTSLSKNLPGRIEELWIDLYKHGFIEERDISAVQIWLQALINCNYQFPDATQKQHRNTALMGQFNSALSLHKVAFWVQKWRSAFDTIVVRGPFNQSQIQDLRSWNIEVYSGADDQGHFSPIENLMRTLKQFRNREGIEGVLYAHDDSMLNLTEITQGKFPFPSEKVIANGLWFPADFSFQNPRRIKDKGTLSTVSFSLFPNLTISNAVGRSFDYRNDLEKKAFYTSLRKWQWWKRDVCVPAALRLANDSRIYRYTEPDGSLLISPFVQADFLYVPTRLSDAFGVVAPIFLESGIFLECAMGTIIDILCQSTNTTVRKVNLCTQWGPNRGTPRIPKKCRRKFPIGVYHPVKMGIGLKEWGEFFDAFALLQTN